jgi:hypothetical protein
MPLKLNKPPGPSSKEIVLPSKGYPYKDFPDLAGGAVLVKAFTFDTEALMYGTSDSSTKQFSRLLEVLKKIAVWPAGFKPAKLLEGDSAIVVMTARALSYPEQTHVFETTCEHCGKPESHRLQIPQQLPQNCYPADFNGKLKITTFNENTIEMRFLTLEDDSECLRLTRDRVNLKLVPEDAFDADYQLHRLAIALVSANGEKPDNMDDARSFFKAMPFDEREEIHRVIRKHAPGLSSMLTIKCPNPDCEETYEAFLPLTMDFFRPRSGAVRAELPAGVRIGVSGPNDPGKGASSPTPNNDVRVSSGEERGGEETGGGSAPPQAPVKPPKPIPAVRPMITQPTVQSS